MPLTYRDLGESRSGTIWDVMSDSLVICRIWKEMQSIDAREQSWAWTFQVAAGGATNMILSPERKTGDLATKKEASGCWPLFRSQRND
jgi:hypothetical protein